MILVTWIKFVTYDPVNKQASNHEECEEDASLQIY